MSTAATDSCADWLGNVELDSISDEAYFLKMRACSYRVRQWDDRYIGLLVGAHHRDLPRRCGFRDVYHMAAVQARMTRKKVADILWVAGRVNCCPGLLRLFTRAQVPWTRMRAVARLARPEWDAELCELVRTRTRRSLEQWVRERELKLKGESPVRSSCPATRKEEEPAATEGVPGGDAHKPADTSASSASNDGREVNANSPFGESGERAEEQGCSRAGAEPGGAARRASPSDAVVRALLSLGLDPLYIQQLLLHREALAAHLGRATSLVEVLSEAIAAYRPTACAVKLPHVLVLRGCCEEGHAFVDSVWGGLPVDASDEAKMRQSGPAVDLDCLPQEEAPGPSSPQACAGQASETPLARPRLRAHEWRLLLARQDGHCAAQGCRRLPSVAHHLDPCALTQRQDVGRISLICRDHHALVHTGAIENPADRPQQWRVRVTPAANGWVDERREVIDRRFLDHLGAPVRRDSQLAETLAVEASGTQGEGGDVSRGRECSPCPGDG